MLERDPTRNERLVALCINLSAIPAPYVAPLIGCLLAPRSSFVRFFALRLILDEIVVTLVSLILVLTSSCWSLISLVRSGFDLAHLDWQLLVIKAVAFWTILQLLALANTIAAVCGAFQAATGQIPKRHIGLSRLAASLSKPISPSNLQ